MSWRDCLVGFKASWVELNNYQKITSILFLYPIFIQNQKLTMLIFVFWSVFSIINFWYSRENIEKNKFWWIGLFSSISLYLIFVLDYLMFSRNNTMLFFLEKELLFLIIPLFSYLNMHSLTKSLRKICMVNFIIGVSLINLYTLGIILNRGFFELLSKDHFYNPIFRNIYSEISNQHLPYLGIMFLFTILIICYFFIVNWSKYNRGIKVLGGVNSILLLVSVFLFSARMALASFVIALAFLIFSLIKEKKMRLLFIASIGATMVLLSLLPPINRRVIEIVQTKLEIPNNNTTSQKANIRYGIYACSLEVLKENGLFGCGMGNTQDKLNECYAFIQYDKNDSFKVRKYNSHNQYLSFILSYGILLGLFIPYILFFDNYRRGDSLAKSFIIIICLACLTENFLERQAGIIIFTLFTSIAFEKKVKKVTVKGI